MSNDAIARVKRIIEGFELGLEIDEVRVEPLEGGASNENFLVQTNGDSWVFRLSAPLTYMDRFGYDRWSGFSAHQQAAAIGVAPTVRAIVLPAGHTLVDFVDGQVLDSESIFNDTNLEGSAQALRKVHTGGIPKCLPFNGLVEIERFMKYARDEHLQLPEDIEELVSLSRQLEDVYQQIDVPEVFCHNDVQIANIIRDRSGRIWVIDWEYAGIGNPYFDLAMVVNNAGLNRQQTDRMLLSYFGAVREADYARIELSRFQSAMRESLWSVVAAPVLATDWDYQEWADRYFESARSIKRRIDNKNLLEVAGDVSDDETYFEGWRNQSE